MPIIKNSIDLIVVGIAGSFLGARAFRVYQDHRREQQVFQLNQQLVRRGCSPVSMIRAHSSLHRQQALFEALAICLRETQRKQP